MQYRNYNRQNYGSLLNELKEGHNSSTYHRPTEIYQGEIYYADLPLDRGAETRGNHPVLVVSSARMNSWSSLILVVPLTSNMTHRGKATHVPFRFVFGKDTKESLALCEQVRALDKTFITSGVIGQANRQTISTILGIIKEYELKEDYT